jgi:hypothetical protein
MGRECKPRSALSKTEIYAHCHGELLMPALEAGACCRYDAAAQSNSIPRSDGARWMVRFDLPAIISSIDGSAHSATRGIQPPGFVRLLGHLLPGAQIKEFIFQVIIKSFCKGLHSACVSKLEPRRAFSPMLAKVKGALWRPSPFSTDMSFFRTASLAAPASRYPASGSAR